MKTSLLKKWKSRIPGQRRRAAKPRGVAILTVLAIIALMTVLVISFFNMAQTQQQTAKGSVEMQRVQNLKDTAINLVIAQMREATTLKDVTWVSGPGWMRTFGNNNNSLNRLYKLYSSPEPMIDGIEVNETDSLLKEVIKDIAVDWDQREDEFVDINRPTFSVSSGTSASNERSDLRRLTYPIADPRRYNGKEDDILENTEGFKYQSVYNGKTIRGVDGRKQQLAMPIRWMYILQDGSLGYLNPEKKFVGLTGKDAVASKTNPIVGRMAWWTDDESCKVNVNTASTPAAWDTPRTTSVEDVELMAKRQPLSGEFQRYPSHPATTDLAAVFFPGQRWTPEPSIISPGGAYRALERDDASLVWDLSPYIVGLDGGEELGTEGGSKARDPNKFVTQLDDKDHLYTSFEELYFKASSKTSNSLNSARDSLLQKDKSRSFLTRLEQSGFFLTHKSHSPETTVSGFPKVTMAAMQKDTPSWVGRKGNLPGNISAYDVTLATNSTIGKKAYYFLREDPTSRHYEIFNTDGRLRNTQLIAYLKALSELDVVGYPELAKGTAFRNLLQKYPVPYHARADDVFQDGGNSARTGSANPDNPYDASERTQILVNFVDYMRSTNMRSGLIPASSMYDAGEGQAAGICCCGKIGDPSSYHGSAIDEVVSKNKLTARGLGRLPGAAAILMMVNIPAWKSADGKVSGTFSGTLDTVSNATWAAQDGPPRVIVEIGFTLAGFCPKHGWGPVSFQTSVGIGTDEKVTGASDPQTPGGLKVPIRVRENKTGAEIQLTTQPAIAVGGNTNGGSNRQSPKGVVLSGGAQGARWSTKGTVALLSPVAITTVEDSGPVDVNITCGRVNGDPGNMRLFIYDSGAGGAGNVVQAIDFTLPPDILGGIKVARSGRKLGVMSTDWFAKPASFPDPQVTWRSLVVPHGDYRIVCNPLRVEEDMYVAQRQLTNSPVSNRGISYFEENVEPALRIPGGAKYNPFVAMIDLPKILRMQTAPDPDMPMLPLPYITQGDLANQRLALQQNTAAGSKFPWKETTHSRVIEMASQNPDRRDIFAWGRRDGPGQANGSPVTPYRGSSDPDETGDFDNGNAGSPDGPYLNNPDDGDMRSKTAPFYELLDKKATTPTSATLSPNLLVRSPVDLGSIPSGTQHRVPWQTLRFRPDPGMNDPSKQMKKLSDVPPPGLPFANFCGPRDHLFLDMLWMPIVEPWSISEPFSTKGTINLNQQIFPFLYIERLTGLYALMRGERMMAIPNAAADKYKNPSNSDKSYRYFINPKETMRQFTMRYAGVDPEEFEVPFNVFRSAAEICEMWLVPDKDQNDSYPDANEWTLEWIIGSKDATDKKGFWYDHKLTGDNVRERPYSNLYPRVCVRSNVFKTHIIAQTIQKATSTDPEIFNAAKDQVTAEWRGSAMVERSVDPNDPALALLDYANPAKSAQGFVTVSQLKNQPKVDEYYTYRVTEVKQITE